MDVYRIKDWTDHFEKNRTKELKHMTWVPMPNKHDGDGYTELLDHPDGAAHFGAWCAIVQVASKCDPRGTLLRDSQVASHEGAARSQEVSEPVLRGRKPHTSASLGRMTRIPEAVIRIATERLVEIGWLEVISLSDLTYDTSHNGAVSPHDDASSRARARVEVNNSNSLAPALGASTATAALNEIDWERVVEECREVVKSVKPQKPEDRELVIKAVALSQTVYDREWLWEVIKRAKRKPTPFRYLHGTLKKRCAERGEDFNLLLKSISVPEQLQRPPSTTGAM